MNMYTRGFAYNQYNTPYPVHPQPSPHAYRSYIYNPTACPFNAYSPSNPSPCSSYNRITPVGYATEPLDLGDMPIRQDINRVIPPPLHGSHIQEHHLPKEKEIFSEPIEKLTENCEKGKGLFTR